MRIVGADTAYPVTSDLIADANKVLGKAASFWGRYFTSPHATGNVEYRHALEDAVLARSNIRVLPVARQTSNVGGSIASGLADGSANALDLIATFGEDYLAAKCGSVCIFLDVEGSGSSRLSSDYYAGWVRGLAGISTKVAFRPCVYGLPGDAATWTALARAVANGVPCHGLWLAHPLLKGPEPVAWNPALVTPSPDPGVPVLLWQYMFPRDGVQIDRNLVSPDIDAEGDLLAFLVPPPAPAVA